MASISLDPWTDAILPMVLMEHRDSTVGARVQDAHESRAIGLLTEDDGLAGLDRRPANLADGSFIARHARTSIAIPSQASSAAMVPAQE